MLWIIVNGDGVLGWRLLEEKIKYFLTGNSCERDESESFIVIDDDGVEVRTESKVRGDICERRIRDFSNNYSCFLRCDRCYCDFDNSEVGECACCWRKGFLASDTCEALRNARHASDKIQWKDDFNRRVRSDRIRRIEAELIWRFRAFVRRVSNHSLAATRLQQSACCYVRGNPCHDQCE